MASRRLLAALMVVAVLLSGAAHVTAATWGVSVQGSMDIPDRELSTKYGTHTVSEFKRVDEGDAVTVDATAPSGELYFVRLIDADENQMESNGSDSGSKSFRFSMDYDPGTYVLAQTNNSNSEEHMRVYDVAPVVVRGYAVELDAPSEASGELSATVTIEEVADSPDPSEVAVVVGDDSDTVEATAEESGDGYEATVSLDSFDEGDYTAYAVVKGEMTESGERNILGVSDTHAVSVAEGSSGGDGGDGGAGGDGGSTGSTGDTPTSTPSNETAAPGNETATPTASPTDTPEGAETAATVTDARETDAEADASTATPDVDADRETTTESPTAAPTSSSPTESATEPTVSTGTTVPVFGPLGIALLALVAVALAVAGRRRA